MDFGQTFKFVRTLHAVKQVDVAKNILARSSISQIEVGNQIPSYTNAINLLNNLGISVQEFEYIRNGYKLTPLEDLIYKFETLSDSSQTEDIKNLLAQAKKLNKTINSQNITNIIQVLTALLHVDDYSEKQLRSVVEPVWQDLSRFDSWTVLDIYLVNNILFFFDKEAATHIIDFSLEMIDSKFPHLLLLKNAFLLNSSYLSIIKNEKSDAVHRLNESVIISKKMHRYDLYLFSLIRLSIISDDLSKAQYYKDLLTKIGASNLSLAVEKEFPQLK
ncbi:MULTISPECIES: helix-turn-helix domain-containing protein [Lactiplantibacillus]|uniref:helix-turn-helix domain-containing protein n=1 Tax=Lactiplantibacillus TaxID=2767842 RepID=UPI000CA30A51|nr:MULTISPECIES: helix-turn-helix transcriptional regulator [Lactiplantibacillus]AUH37907.1 hypothetical protein CXZ13_11735 [Lactiplantibacillus plantarum]MBQ0837138.1 helix-turn-helix transcriptional regulator [Lactiplantibacillus pentosus]MBU7464936.1 helix-turn-helix transcriptional regulator [Lactiplantibacillus pentosus]MBU7490846.1 helix-turn-helix transcriptional regulator [Lactiplantibacillus pentosus]MBU7495189.1 helix-turn-helix transcriptional regulator [Lactiplantibacillus pentosu